MSVTPADPAISLQGVSKVFKRYKRPVERLQEIILPGKRCGQEFWALKDISLEIPRGETWGIVGRNGAGKSTLLKIITGTLQPTSGTVQVHGRVSALLELGSGFNPEFTGRQNVFFNGQLLGLSQSEVEERFEDIAAFADIGDYLEQPVKTYSSGMRARLAFAVASSTDPDVLIVDEVLGVGDAYFQHKCAKRMRTLMSEGVTTLFVSHNAASVKTLCNWSILIERGTVQTCGIPQSVLSDYMKRLTDEKIKSAQSPTSPLKEINKSTDSEYVLSSNNLKTENIKTLNTPLQSFRRGNQKMIIENIKILKSNGHEITNNDSIEFNEFVEILVKIRANKFIEDYLVGFQICDKNGNEIVATNTKEEDFSLRHLYPSDEKLVKFRLNLPLKPTSYSLNVAVTENQDQVTSDKIDCVIIFEVLPPANGKKVHGMVDLPVSISSES